MIPCRYVSSDSTEIGLREFDAVGQRAVFSEIGFREAVLGRAAFIPEEEFLKIGFTQQELDKYGQAGERVDPTPEFCEKLIRSQSIYRELRDKMLQGYPIEVLADGNGEFASA